jgi:hypothetical protein
MRFQPVVEVQPELLFGMRRHSLFELVEPRLRLVQSPARLLGLPEALIAQ